MLPAYPLETFMFCHRGDIGIATNHISTWLERKEPFRRFHEEIRDGDGVLHGHGRVSKRHLALCLHAIDERLDRCRFGTRRRQRLLQCFIKAEKEPVDYRCLTAPENPDVVLLCGNKHEVADVAVLNLNLP